MVALLFVPVQFIEPEGVLQRAQLLVECGPSSVASVLARRTVRSLKRFLVIRREAGSRASAAADQGRHADAHGRDRPDRAEHWQ